MVEPIGMKPGRTVESARSTVASMTPSARIADAQADRVRTSQDNSLAVAAQEMGQKPPVDADRVARIRKAIADGSFPILPATIADRLIALKFDWKPDDAA